MANRFKHSSMPVQSFDMNRRPILQDVQTEQRDSMLRKFTGETLYDFFLKKI
jgi:hypothetical protein